MSQDLITTAGLKPGDLVILRQGPHYEVGRRYLIERLMRDDSLSLVPATKAGVPDKRYSGWTGSYKGALWERVDA